MEKYRYYGDLNKDNLTDAVLVIEKKDKANFVKNESLGASLLNTNPRRLIIAFQSNGAYHSLLVNDHFLPAEGDTEAPCLEDPLAQGGIEIKKGLLKISFHHWYSCGSWYVNHNTYSFRYQHGKFALIGFDSDEFHPSSGQSSQVSINYLTRKKKTTTGLNEFAEATPKVKW